MRMPGLDGYEIARWLGVRGACCPLLVAVTGLVSPAHRARARAVGFDHFLVKPVDPEVLVRLLGTYAAALAEPAPDASRRRCSCRRAACVARDVPDSAL
jgi:CheY-like chemotaxis protein